MQWTKGNFLGCMMVILLAASVDGCGKETQTDLSQLEIQSDLETDSVKQQDAESDSTDQQEAETPDVIMVYVCGEVECSGVYELPAGSRLYQAIEAAGGMKDTAADTYLNQAEQLSDGQSVYVPTAEEAEAMGPAVNAESQTADSGSVKVNINTASKEELMTLNGIGEAKALSIIEYRDTNGVFRSIEDIMKIPGIKDGVFQKIKDQISI